MTSSDLTELRETPRLRWFDPFAPCAQCGKTAHGLLRGVSNDSYGAHCRRCADKRLKLSAKVRDELAKASGESESHE